MRRFAARPALRAAVHGPTLAVRLAHTNSGGGGGDGGGGGGVQLCEEGGGWLRRAAEALERSGRAGPLASGEPLRLCGRGLAGVLSLVGTAEDALERAIRAGSYYDFSGDADERLRECAELRRRAGVERARCEDEDRRLRAVLGRLAAFVALDGAEAYVAEQSHQGVHRMERYFAASILQVPPPPPLPPHSPPLAVFFGGESVRCFLAATLGRRLRACRESLSKSLLRLMHQYTRRPHFVRPNAESRPAPPPRCRRPTSGAKATAFAFAPLRCAPGGLAAASSRSPPAPQPPLPSPPMPAGLLTPPETAPAAGIELRPSLSGLEARALAPAPGPARMPF